VESRCNIVLSKEMKIKFFALYMMVVLLCLSSGSCKRELAPEERKENIEITNDENYSVKKETDSLNNITIDSKTKAGEMKKKDVILRKTKAQYVIY